MAPRFRILLALLLAFPLPALGQALPDSTVALPDVTVTATRVETAAALAPVRVTVLDRGAIEATGSTSVADVLETRTPLFVRRLGAGGLATVSLRGTTPEQTLLLLDGHRISDPQTGQLDLSLLPAILLHSVEVAYGAGSALYGTDAVGGVINVRTLAPGSGPQLRAMGTYGAYGEHTGSLLVSQQRGRFSGLALVEYDAAEGDFPFLNETLFPPREVRRTGADRTRRSLLSSLRYAGERHAFNLSGWYTDAERGLPGLATAPSSGERQWDESLRLWADDRIRLGRSTLRVGGLVQRSALRYANTSLDLDQTGTTLTTSLEAEATIPAGPRWLFVGGLTGGNGKADHFARDATAAEIHTGAYLSATGSYGRLLLYPALRSDVYISEDAETRAALSPRLALNIQPFTAHRIYLKASAGRAFRIPTFNERFWRPGGNPNLRPEHGWTFDGGVYVQRARAHAEFTAFAGLTHDQIEWRPTAEGYWAPLNVVEVHRRGVEIGYHRDPVPTATHSLYGGFVYSYVQALDRSDPAARTYGRQLRYVPRDQAKVYVGAALGPLTLDLNGRYVGRRYVTADESEYLDHFIVVDVQARLAFHVSGLRAQLSLAVENLGNSRYAVLPHYPMPPRHATLRLLIETRSPSQ